MPSVHVVKQGQHLATIARLHGYVGWQPIYDDPGNAQLWKRGRSPEILFPGDRVTIPDKQPNTFSRPTGAAHDFKLKRADLYLHLVLKDTLGNVLAGEPFVLHVQSAMEVADDGGLPIEGTTSAKGRIDVPLPRGAVKAFLVFARKPWLSRRLLIGHLDPLQDPTDKKAVVTGAQARLNNLGFGCGKVDGELGPKTRAAIRRFQDEVMELEEPTGELDDDTLKAIEEQYGT